MSAFWRSEPTDRLVNFAILSTGVFAFECAMDELAYTLKMDPLQLRLANYAELATDARLLVASEWCQWVLLHAIDRDPSDLESTRDGLGMLGLRREHVRMEPEGRVVRDGDGFILVAIRDDAQHGAEDLFLRDGHVVADIGEHGRLDEVAAVQPSRTTFAAGDERCTLLEARGRL